MYNYRYNTSADEARHGLANERAALTADIENGARSEQLARRINTIAALEGEYAVYAELDALLKVYADKGDTLELMQAHLLRYATRDADDQWSGRCNDVRRAYQDGVRGSIGYITREILQDAIDDAQAELAPHE